MVNVGIIGMGCMGCTHYGIYKQNPLAKVVAICDARKDRLKGKWGDVTGNLDGFSSKAEDLTGINTYSDFGELFEDDNVDLIDICLSTNMHHRVALAALKTGKHILLEKPMALNSTEAAEIAQAAEKSKGFFMVGHCIRFWPQYAAAYEMVKSKKYGKIKEAFFRRVSRPPVWADKNWFMNAAKSGGALLDLQIHDVDYMLYLLGKPKTVYSYAVEGPSGGFDTIHSIFGYEKATAAVIASWDYHGNLPFNMEFCINCEKATAAYDLLQKEPLTFYTDDDGDIKPDLSASDGYAHEIDYLLNCIDKKRKPEIVTAKSSLETIMLIEVQKKSIETGEVVKL